MTKPWRRGLWPGLMIGVFLSIAFVFGLRSQGVPIAGKVVAVILAALIVPALITAALYAAGIERIRPPASAPTPRWIVALVVVMLIGVLLYFLSY